MKNIFIAYMAALTTLCLSCGTQNEWEAELPNKKFTYEDVTGIGFEHEITRRDPSDIIKVGDTYYVYYTKVNKNFSGYYGTLWCAKSTDEGYNWEEVGEVLGKGEAGTFDSAATFTPNVIYANGKYYLYYTGVRPTPGNKDGKFENNATTDFTAIGLAISTSPDSGFERYSQEPILTVSDDPEAFDSYRIDDAAMLYRDGKYWLYYKGRSIKDGKMGPKLTKMGVAVAESPEGEFVRVGDYIQERGHEVLIFPCNGKVYSLASLSSTVEMAKDGLDFTSNPLSLEVADIPFAPGAFRADLTNPDDNNQGLNWGLAIKRAKRDLGLIRYSFN